MDDPIRIVADGAAQSPLAAIADFGARDRTHQLCRLIAGCPMAENRRSSVIVHNGSAIVEINEVKAGSTRRAAKWWRRAHDEHK